MKIILATLHAKYIHASLALPCLAAARGGVPGTETVLHEFTVNEPLGNILRTLMEEDADLVAFSCYIWNVEQTLRIISDLKKLRPGIFVVVGGPEVSYTAEEFLMENLEVDCVVRGEGERTWKELLEVLADGAGLRDLRESLPAGITMRLEGGIVASRERAPLEDLDEVPSPFALGLVDLKKPLVYYETSRGCPFSCAFCISSLEKGVRSFSPGRIRDDLRLLMDREVALVKLVDRTFNYDARRADDIWEYILLNNRSTRFHFEISADLLTDQNLRTLSKAPPGMFRFEIGVQSVAEETLSRVSRRSDVNRLLDNVRRLTEETGVTVHLDLIAGLPGEDYPGFLRSLQRLFPLRPHHIQVEPLKVLKGSPMEEIARSENYAFSSRPPYKILRTPQLSFTEIGRIEDVSRLLDIYFNSGRFSRSLDELEANAPLAEVFSSMAVFFREQGFFGQISLKEQFGVLRRFAGEFLPAAGYDGFLDALCFDYCCVEYPSGGALPDLFPAGSPQGIGVVPRTLLAPFLRKLDVPEGSRVRSVSGRFRKNFSSRPAVEGSVRLLFIYISAPGAGLSVHVCPWDEAIHA